MFAVTLMFNKMIANGYNVGSFFDNSDGGKKRIPPN
jgi:hypothetical protein